MDIGMHHRHLCEIAGEAVDFYHAGQSVFNLHLQSLVMQVQN